MKHKLHKLIAIILMIALLPAYSAFAESAVDASAQAPTTYITGINGLFEKDNGPESGWIYTVNGKMIMKPCSKCLLSPNDIVKWTYLTHFNTTN